MEQQLSKVDALLENIVITSRSDNGQPIHNSVDVIENALIPLIHKLHCSNPAADGSLADLPGKAHLVSISQYLAELYIQHASNSKVSHRFKKMIHKIERILPESSQHVQEATLKFITPEDDTCGLDLVTLKSVSNLLEDSTWVRKAIQANFPDFISTLAITLTDAVTFESAVGSDANYATSNLPTMQMCHLGAKICLQLCQHTGDKLQDILWSQRGSSGDCCPSGESCSDNTKLTQDFHQILQALLDMISSKRFSKECSIMAGGALAMVLNSATNKKEADNIALNMLDLHDNCEVWKPEMATQAPANSKLNIGNCSLICKCPSGESATRQFSQLTLLRGLLTCSKNESLLQDKAVLLDVLFPLVCRLCCELRDMQYHALQVLTYWLQATKNALPVLHQSQDDSSSSPDPLDTSSLSSRQRIFCTKSKVVDEVLAIAWQSWQSPVEGVPELVKSVVALLLQAYEEENKLLGICECKLFKMITTRLQQSPWHVKGRYPLLCTVIPHCSTAELLASYPVLPSHLLECLGTNHLASAATEVYRVCLKGLQVTEKRIKRRKSDDAISPEINGKTEWEVFWQQAVLTGLCSDNELVRYHTANYWLPLTVKFFTESYEIMRRALQPLQGVVHDARVLHAHIMLLQQARMNQINEHDWMAHNWDIINAALQHAEEDIRSDALSMICISPKKSHLPSNEEFQLIQNSMPQNLNCDSASFRNKLNKSVKTVLVRTRDGSLACLRQLKKEEVKGDAANREKMEQLHKQLSATIDFLKNFMDMSVSSLFPGACYQRKRTALDIISLLYETLLQGCGMQKRQDGTSGSAGELLEWAKNHHQFDLQSARTAALILNCIQDGSNDIRSLSFHLLTSYFPSVLPSCPSFPATSNNEILCNGLRLISHPKAHMADAGALLCKLTFNKVWSVKDSPSGPSDSSTSSSAHHGNQLPRGIDAFVTKLLDILRYQFDCACQNFVSAAALTPMHGTILTIRRCLVDDPHILQLISTKAPVKWAAIIESIISTIHEIVFFILGVLAGRKTEEEEEAARNLAPSFGQMGEAIDGLIGALAHVQLDEKGKEEKSSRTDEHQIVLSCCWLNLKESSLLLGGLAESSPFCDGERKGGLLKLPQLQSMADIMIEILTKCRHKGAIEGCNQGFSRFCARVLSSPNPQFASLPRNLLDRVLAILTTEAAESSVTKKSAGLPLVVESIVVAEPKGRERHLLQYTMQKLTAIAKQPLPDNPNGTLDMPQTHAINIMRALFRCSAINTAMLAYVAEAVEYAISGFDSPCWAVRNCCMQLFGTLVARIFGQKRVADEHSNLNSLSASEFVFRYPSLKQYLLEEMRQAAKKSPQKMISGDSCGEKVKGQELMETNKEVFLLPTMHPVLTLLAKLGLGVEQDTAKRTLEDFMEPVMSLLSSPIYSIRELASRAILPLIPEGNALHKALEVISGLPRQPCDVQSTNQLHGHLLLIHALIKIAIEDKSMCLEQSKAVLESLSQVSWLASSNNTCAIVRALFVSIFNETVSWMQTGMSEDICDLVGWISDEAQMYLETCPDYQVGLPALNKAMTCVLLTLSPSISDCIASIMKLLTSPHRDTRLAALEYAHKHSTQAMTVEFCTRSWDLLCHLVLIEQNILCLQAGLELWVHISCTSGSAISTVQYDNVLEVWKHLSGMADGKKGTTLCASSLPVLSIILKDHLEVKHANSGPMLAEWSNWMLQYSDPVQTETFRLSVAKSLQICGLAALSASCLSNIEENIPSALCVFSAGLRLLQDEQSCIRMEAASFATQLPRGEGCSNYPSVGTYQGIQVLVSYVCKYCTWSYGCYTALTRLLRGPDTPSNVVWQQGGTRSVHLFEQESSNIYAEGVMEAKVLYQNLLDMTCAIHQVDASGLRNWLHSKCSKAVKNLKDTLTALDQVLIMECDYYKATSQSKVFQVVYRQLLYVQLLQKMAQLTLIEGDGLWKDIRTLGKLQATLNKAADVHPLLKEALPTDVRNESEMQHES